MHLRSGEEINLIRLLSRCEEMASQKQSNWRLEQYVEALKDKLLQVKKLDTSVKPKDEVLKEYQQKINFLCQFINASKLKSVSEKSVANQFLAPSRTKTISTKFNIPSGKEIQITASADYGKTMRDELFSTVSTPNKDGVRHRETSSKEDVDAVLQHQQKLQEKVAEEMVALTRNLKHNVIASNQIIKSDCETLSRSIKQTDSNYDKLQKETNRLDKHLQKGTNWWLWISLTIVCGVFFGMIFFIRFFPKF